MHACSTHLPIRPLTELGGLQRPRQQSRLWADCTDIRDKYASVKVDTGPCCSCVLWLFEFPTTCRGCISFSS